MNGKGDSPRNNYSRQFRDNYDMIDWRKKPTTDTLHTTDVSSEEYKNEITNQNVTENIQE